MNKVCFIDHIFSFVRSYYRLISFFWISVEVNQNTLVFILFFSFRCTSNSNWNMFRWYNSIFTSRKSTSSSQTVFRDHWVCVEVRWIQGIVSLAVFHHKTLLKVVWTISLFSNFRCELQRFKMILVITDECWCVKAHQCIRSQTKMKILTATWMWPTKCRYSTQKQRQC